MKLNVCILLISLSGSTKALLKNPLLSAVTSLACSLNWLVAFDNHVVVVDIADFGIVDVVADIAGFGIAVDEYCLTLVAVDYD